MALRRKRRRAGVALGAVTIWLALAGTGQAAAPPPPAESDTNLPVPRFVSLHSDKVNMRTGPGDRYPIEWVLTRRDMPVEIVQQFEHWRRVRDWEGTEGWVHERMLAGKRDVIVKGGTRALYRRPDPNSGMVARAESGVVAKLLECQGAWCRIDASEASGWVRRSDVWGVYPDETIQ